MYMLQLCRGVKQGCFEYIQQAALLIILHSHSLLLSKYDKDHVTYSHLFNYDENILIRKWTDSRTLCQCIVLLFFC